MEKEKEEMAEVAMVEEGMEREEVVMVVEAKVVVGKAKEVWVVGE